MSELVGCVCGGAGYMQQLRGTCPVCLVEDARIVHYYPASTYYGWRIRACAECGDRWDVEYHVRLSRPFARDWRVTARARITADWDAADPRDPIIDPEDDRWLSPDHAAVLTLVGHHG